MKIKKLVVLLLSMAMLLPALTGCGQDENQDKADQGGQTEQEESSANGEQGESEPVTLRIFMAGKSTPDDDAVAEYISSLPQVQALNVTIEIVKQPGASQELFEKLPLLLTTDEQMDIGWDQQANFANRVNQGAYIDISDYLAEDSEFYDYIPESLWTGMKKGDAIYGVPCYKEIAEQWAFFAEQEILDKYDIDPSTITDFQDAEQILEALDQEGDREGFMVIGSDYNYLVKLGLADDYDFVNDYRYLAIDREEGKTIVNTFETEEFAELVNTMYDWNQKGYISPDALTETSVLDDLAAGTLKYGLGYTSYSPLYEITASPAYYAENLQPIFIAGEPRVTNASVRGSVFGIYNKCENPERAYEFLRLWNTDSEVKNAFCYGIPGIHYDLVDGKVERLDGSDERYTAQNWTTGNVMISYLTVDEPDNKYEEYEAFNDSATEAWDLGIFLNVESISDKIANIEGVIAEYLPVVILGFTDPESGIATLNEQLKAAGIDDVITEVQEQYDEFLATK